MFVDTAQSTLIQVGDEGLNFGIQMKVLRPSQPSLPLNKEITSENHCELV